MLPGGKVLAIREARFVADFGCNVISEGLLLKSGFQIDKARDRMAVKFPDGNLFFELRMEPDCHCL